MVLGSVILLNYSYKKRYWISIWYKSRNIIEQCARDNAPNLHCTKIEPKRNTQRNMSKTQPLSVACGDAT